MQGMYASMSRLMALAGRVKEQGCKRWQAGCGRGHSLCHRAGCQADRAALRALSQKGAAAGVALSRHSQSYDQTPERFKHVCSAASVFESSMHRITLISGHLSVQSSRAALEPSIC